MCPRKEGQPPSAGRIFASAQPLWREWSSEGTPTLLAFLQAPGFDSLTEMGGGDRVRGGGGVLQSGPGRLTLRVVAPRTTSDWIA